MNDDARHDDVRSLAFTRSAYISEVADQMLQSCEVFALRAAFMTGSVTVAENRALACIWADVEPGFGVDPFGHPEAGLTLEALFGDFLLRYRVQHKPNMRVFRPRARTFRRDADGALIVECVGEKDRRYDAHLVLNPDGSVAVFAIGRAVPDGMCVREARADEFERVAEVLRDSPVITGERSFSIWLKRLPEALAMQRDFSVIVAEREHDGKLMAARIAGRRTGVFLGETLSVGQAYQAGVLPEARGHGLENALIPLMTRALRAQRFFGLIDVGNAAILQSMSGIPVWNYTVRQIGAPALPSARMFGRPATAEDAPRLLEMLVGAHGRKEWRPSFDLEWVRRRFTTIASYGWDCIRMTDAAFVAFWPAGDVVADVSPSRSRHARFGYMADYGFLRAAGLRDFARLVEDAQRRAFDAMCTHAIAYTCDAALGHDVLSAAAEFDDRMHLTIPPPEPDAVVHKGVYVDAFYA